MPPNTNQTQVTITGLTPQEAQARREGVWPTT
jgi:hypothetical protein